MENVKREEVGAEGPADAVQREWIYRCLMPGCGWTSKRCAHRQRVHDHFSKQHEVKACIKVFRRGEEKRQHDKTYQAAQYQKRKVCTPFCQPVPC